MLPFEVKKWFVVHGATRYGPYSIVDLQAMIARVEVSLTDPVWCEGMAQAKLMSQIDELKFLTEQPAVRRGAAHQPGLEEETERTMAASSAAPKRLGPAPGKSPSPRVPEPEPDPDNEPTQVMSRPARSVARNIGAKRPAPPASAPAEPEDIRSLELDQPGATSRPPPAASPPQSGSVSRAETPSVNPPPVSRPTAPPPPARVMPPPPVIESPPPEPEPEPPQDEVEEPAPPEFESLEEKMGDGTGTDSAAITFTNPFVKTGTGTYKKKKKKIPLQWVVLSAGCAVFLMIAVFFYQMAKPPGTASKDIAQIATTSFEIDNALVDTQPQEHAELVFAHGAKLTADGIKVGVARSTHADSNLKFYIATNLPPKSRLIVSLEPFRETGGPLFLRRIQVEPSRLMVVDSGIPLKRIHPGEYYFFAVEDVDQAPDTQIWIERMRTTPRRIPSVRELKKLVISKRYTF